MTHLEQSNQSIFLSNPPLPSPPIGHVSHPLSASRGGGGGGGGEEPELSVIKTVTFEREEV